MSQRKLINKIIAKKSAGKCYFCECNNYELLDLHRIVEGSNGGKYTDFNTIICCSLCHRKIHAGMIRIDRKYTSTAGKTVLHYWINGEEKWL